MEEIPASLKFFPLELIIKLFSIRETIIRIIGDKLTWKRLVFGLLVGFLDYLFHFPLGNKVFLSLYFVVRAVGGGERRPLQSRMYCRNQSNQCE